MRPYQTTVPSFGIWGYALAKLEPFDAPTKPPPGLELRFLRILTSFEFSSDTSRPDEEIEVNRLDNQVVRYYEAEWRKFEQ